MCINDSQSPIVCLFHISVVLLPTSSSHFHPFFPPPHPSVAISLLLPPSFLLPQTQEKDIWRSTSLSTMPCHAHNATIKKACIPCAYIHETLQGLFLLYAYIQMTNQSASQKLNTVFFSLFEYDIREKRTLRMRAERQGLRGKKGGRERKRREEKCGSGRAEDGEKWSGGGTYIVKNSRSRHETRCESKRPLYCITSGTGRGRMSGICPAYLLTALSVRRVKWRCFRMGVM